MKTSQVKEMVRLRKLGLTYQKIADVIGCHHVTVRNYLIYAGVVQDHYAERFKTKCAMLLHDWNTGASCESLAKKYGYKSVAVLYESVRNLRKKGMAFELRNRWTDQRKASK